MCSIAAGIVLVFVIFYDCDKDCRHKLDNRRQTEVFHNIQQLLSTHKNKESQRA